MSRLVRQVRSSLVYHKIKKMLHNNLLCFAGVTQRVPLRRSHHSSGHQYTSSFTAWFDLVLMFNCPDEDRKDRCFDRIVFPGAWALNLIISAVRIWITSCCFTTIGCNSSTIAISFKIISFRSSNRIIIVFVLVSIWVATSFMISSTFWVFIHCVFGMRGSNAFHPPNGCSHNSINYDTSRVRWAYGRVSLYLCDRGLRYQGVPTKSSAGANSMMWEACRINTDTNRSPLLRDELADQGRIIGS